MASNISSLSLTQLHFDDQISVKNWHNIIVAYAQWQTLCKREAYFFLFILCNIISSWSSFSSSKHCLLTASYFLFTATITKQRNSMYRGNWLHLILCILQIRWFYQLIRYIVFDGLVVCSKRAARYIKSSCLHAHKIKWYWPFFGVKSIFFKTLVKKWYFILWIVKSNQSHMPMKILRCAQPSSTCQDLSLLVPSPSAMLSSNRRTLMLAYIVTLWVTNSH